MNAPHADLQPGSGGTRRARGRWRRLFVRVLALGVVGCALLISLAKLGLPWLAANPELVQSQLSHILRTEVKIGSASSRWESRPRLVLHQLSLGNELKLARAEVELDLFGFLPNRHWVKDFSLFGLDLQVAQNEHGAWKILGLKGDKFDPKVLNALAQLSIRDATVRIVRGERSVVLRGAGLALRRERGLLKAGLLAPLPGDGNEKTQDSRTGLSLIGADARSSSLSVRVAWAPEQQQLSGFVALENAQFGQAEKLLELFDLQLGGASGSVHAQLWVDFTTGTLRRGKLDLHLQDDQQRPSLHLAASAANGENWLGELQLFAPAAAGASAQTVPIFARSALSVDSQSHAVTAATLQLELGDRTPSPLAGLNLDTLAFAVAAHSPGQFAKTVASLAPRGQLGHGYLEVGKHTPWRAAARFQQLGINAFQQIPGFSGADLSVQADASAVSFALDAQQFVLDAQRLFRGPVPAANLTVRGAVWPNADAAKANHFDWREWELEAPLVLIEDPDYRASGFVNADRVTSEPGQIHIGLHVESGSLNKAGRFWTPRGMAPQFIAWADRAFKGGRVQNAHAVYRGPLLRNQFPFANYQGRFETQFELEQGTLAFNPQWPQLEKLTGQFAMLNGSLRVLGAKAELAGNPVDRLQGQIQDFRLPVLELDFSGGRNAQQLLALIRRTPFGRSNAKSYENLSLVGNASTSASLRWPLKPGAGERALDGRFVLDKVKLDNSDWTLNLEQLSGALRFDLLGFSTETLTAIRETLPVQFSARLGYTHTQNSRRLVEATLVGTMPPQSVFGQDVLLGPILKKITGASELAISVGVDRVAPDLNYGAEFLTRAEVVSNLRGLSIDLPSPLGKHGDEARAMRLFVPLSVRDARKLDLRIGQEVRFIAKLGLPEAAREEFSAEQLAEYSKLGRDKFRGVLALGRASQTETGNSLSLPKRGLTILGDLPELDPAQWSGLAGSTAEAAGGIEIAEVDLRADRLVGTLASLGRRARLQIAPKMEADGSKSWSAKIDTAAANGQLLYRAGTSAENAGITAQFTRLHLPEPSGHSTGQASTTAENEDVNRLDPRTLPALHLYIEDFKVGAATLGATRLETFPTANGMRIDLLESKSKLLTLTGSGDWLSANGSSRSLFELRFSAEDLGAMLATLGFAGHVNGGQTLVELNAGWEGPPTEFALAKLNGDLKVWVGSGRFLELNPGAGRVFGLLSVRELPRRLALDFSDFFRSGMSFTEATGNFKFEAGNAFTENLLIRSPAADIRVRGRTGLSARDYEQTVFVNPKVGVLPVVGAIVSGPVGAAAGLLAQGVLEKEKTLGTEYRVLGTWDKPLVQRQSAVRAAERKRETRTE